MPLTHALSRHSTALFIVGLLTLGQNAHGIPMQLLDKETVAPADRNAGMFSLLDKGDKAAAARDYKRAHDLFDQAQKQYPKSPIPALAHADLYRVENKPAEIEQALKKASAIAPNDNDVLVAWAHFSYARNDFKTAEEYLQKAIKLSPKSAVLYIKLADVYLNGMKQADQAAETYRTAISLSPGQAGAHAGLGGALLALNDRKAAQASFERAEQLAPENPLAPLAIARLLAAERRCPAAIPKYERVLTLSPDATAVRVELADCQTMEKKYADAIGNYNKAATALPNNPAIPGKLGIAYQESGNAPSAFSAYERSIKLNPKAALVLNNLAMLAAERKERLGEADGWIKRAREIAPDAPELLDTQIAVLLAAGKNSEALTQLSASIDKMPPSALLRYRHGLLLEAAGRDKDALEAYRKALQIEPNFASAQDAAGRIAKLSRK
ncbi:MAG: repeat-containing protein [Rhodocyclales bacterium]|nr:repeat-containing protein [Rhodocyclales bacterium]